MKKKPMINEENVILDIDRSIALDIIRYWLHEQRIINEIRPTRGLSSTVTAYFEEGEAVVSIAESSTITDNKTIINWHTGNNLNSILANMIIKKLNKHVRPSIGKLSIKNIKDD